MPRINPHLKAALNEIGTPKEQPFIPDPFQVEALDKLEVGDVIVSVPIPELKAPVDFKPKTTQVSLNAPAGNDLSQCTICIDPEEKGLEITRLNNSVYLSGIVGGK